MKCLLKNIFIDKLFGLVDKDNNTYHITIKIKPIDIKANTYICSNKEIKHKDPKIKIDNIIRISNVKPFLKKTKLQSGKKELWWLKRLKIMFLDLVINKVEVENIVGTFWEKELQNTNKKEFKNEKVMQKEINYMLIAKDIIILLIVGLIKNHRIND